MSALEQKSCGLSKATASAGVHIPLTAKGFLLLRHAISVIYGELSVNHAPIHAPTRPFLRDIHRGQIQHFQQAVVRREHGFRFGDLPKLAVESFNRIRRIDQPANLLRKFEVGAQIRPVFTPRRSNLRILLAPSFLQIRPERPGRFAHPKRHIPL